MLLKKSWACNWTYFHIKIFLFFACFTDIRLKVSPNSKSLIKIPLTVTIHVKNHRTYTAYICTQYKKLVFSIHITSNSITVACSTERKARLFSKIVNIYTWFLNTNFFVIKTLVINTKASPGHNVQMGQSIQEWTK